MFISILTPFVGIVGSFRLHFKAVFLPFGDNIVGIDGLQGDGAAYAAFHITAERGAFFDGNAADDVGVDVVAVVCARVAAPDGNRLLRAVDGNGNPSLSLYAAYIGIQRAAVHAGHAAQKVGYGVAFEGLNFVFAFVKIDDFSGINPVFTDFVFIACAFDSDGIENNCRIICSINGRDETNGGDAGGEGGDFDRLHRMNPYNLIGKAV